MTFSAMTGSPAWTAKALRRLRGLLPGGVEAGELDRLERVLAARFGSEDDLQSAGGRLDPGFDRRIEIAARAQEFGEQLGIRAGAAVDLRGVDGLAAPFAKRRLRIEGLDQSRLVIDRLQALRCRSE